MTENEMREVRQIRSNYEFKNTTGLDEIKKLDKKARVPALVFAYSFGIIGALVLGFGMCMAMKVIFDAMFAGIAVGIVGIVMVSVNYPIYNKLKAMRMRKYAEKINALSEEILERQ